MIKKIWLALLTALLIVACALLPSAAAIWQDHRQIGRMETETIEPITLRTDDSSLIDRLRLCSSNQLYCEVRNMPIGTGVRYQENTVIEQAWEQLRLLCTTAGILQFDAALYDARILGIEFLADPGDPANNAMVWRIGFYSESGSVEALVDDESGLLIALVADDTGSAPAAQELDDIAAAWTEYLGLASAERLQTDGQVAVTEHYDAVQVKKEEKFSEMSYGSVVLTHPDDPNGFSVQYLLRATSNSLWITIA